MMTFHVGQKVVCVDAEWTNRYNIPQLKDGCIYTVRWIGPCPPLTRWQKRLNLHHRGAALSIRLHEVHREGSDKPFAITRFRPAVERKTDISIFTKMLTDARVNERV